VNCEVQIQRKIHDTIKLSHLLLQNLEQCIDSYKFKETHKDCNDGKSHFQPKTSWFLEYEAITRRKSERVASSTLRYCRHFAGEVNIQIYISSTLTAALPIATSWFQSMQMISNLFKCLGLWLCVHQHVEHATYTNRLRPVRLFVSLRKRVY